MSERPKSVVTATDFPGLILNADPTDLPPGAGRKQVNVTSAILAALEVRPGYRVVQFEEVDT